MCSPPGGSTTPEGDRLTAETVAPGGSPSASEQAGRVEASIAPVL
jgi:hypothetical protein